MNVDDLDAILSGEPVEAMEAAKRIIQRGSVRPITLVPLARNKAMRLWTRIAAIWLLGFIDDDRVSVPDLEHIFHDQNEAEQIREHAAEAIAHLKPYSG